MVKTWKNECSVNNSLQYFKSDNPHGFVDKGKSSAHRNSNFITRKSKDKEATVWITSVAQKHTEDVARMNKKLRSWWLHNVFFAPFSLIRGLHVQLFCHIPHFYKHDHQCLPACMLFLLQAPLIDQHHPNRVVPQHGSHHSLSYPLPHPPLPLSPQKATPHRVPWRRRKQLPSVGSRWTASPFPSLFLFFPRSWSPDSLTFIFPNQSLYFYNYPSTAKPLCACMRMHVNTELCPHMISISLLASATQAAELLSDTGSMWGQCATYL